MLYRLARPLLFALEPERAHRLTLSALEIARRCRLTGLITGQPPSIPVRAMGLEFPNPVGLAAGLDKNAEHVDALAALGFGFIEVGTVTPRPQPGNPAPRLFRVPQARALINRMGFNNDGVERLLFNLKGTRYRGVLGINIGKNFDTPIERAVEDYLYCLRKVYPVASYVAVNISSPNTRDLRALQHGAELERLLAALAAEREKLAEQSGRRVPLAVKIAPDLDSADIDAIARLLLAHGVEAAIATNTTVSREGVAGWPHGAEAGGLSGAPLHERATGVLRQLAKTVAGRVVLIGVGGILSAQDAADKFAAGAALVQLYTGLIYQGPGLVPKAARALVQHRKL